MLGRRSPSVPRIVAIGDSIIEGTGATENHGWIYLFAQQFRSDFELINNGEGGSTTEYWVRHLQADCIDLRPSIVILGIGTNDARYRPSINRSEVPLESFEKNLSWILKTIRRKTSARILVSGQTPVLDKYANPYKDDKSHIRNLQPPYEHAIYQATAREGVLYFDNFARWLSHGEDFIERSLADGLHPNNAGHAEIARYAHYFFLLHSDAQGPS